MVVPNSNPLETKLFQLMADKQKLESQINAFGDILAQVFYFPTITMIMQNFYLEIVLISLIE